MNKNRRKKSIRSILSILLIGGMLLTNTGMMALAETVEENAEISLTESEEAAKAESERIAAEEAAKAESERIAAEEAAKAESERIAAEEAAKAESKLQTEEFSEPVTEPVTEEMTEPVTEEMTETQPESEPETRSETEEATTEAESETETEAESESETEKIEVVLDTVINQEVIQEITADNKIQPIIKYTVKVRNRTKGADAANVSVKVLLAPALSYIEESGQMEGISWFSSMEEAISAGAVERGKINDSHYAGCEVLTWQESVIKEDAEKSYVFYARVDDGVTDIEMLRNAWIINGDEITDNSRILWLHTEKLAVEEELPSEFTYEDDNMIVTAVLSNARILPKGAVFVVREKELAEKDRALIEDSLDKDQVIEGYAVYDMHFEVDGQEVEPENGTVAVSVQYKKSIELEDPALDEKVKTEDTEYKVLHLEESVEGKSVVDVTENVSSSKDGQVKEAEFITDSFSDIVVLGVGRAVSAASNDTYNRAYTLENFLTGYNVLAFGDVNMNIHCMGAVLVQGDYTQMGSGFGDGDYLPPSYVKGKVSTAGPYNSRNQEHNEALYVGPSNEVEVFEGHPYFKLNGVSSYGSKPPIYVSDHYFDFNRAYRAVKGTALALLQDRFVVKPVNGVITINGGTSVTIESLSGISGINIVGNMANPVNTIINILDGGAVNLPQEWINGSQPSVQEQGSGTSIVWNVPNASSLTIPTQSWVGHVIAPDASVIQASGNYNGCIVCKSLATSAEGHMYPYNGGSLVPTEGEFRASKTVDGKEPASDQKFKFTMRQIDDFGDFSKTVRNDGSIVDFGSISYEEEGVYYYMIEEEQEGSGAEYTFDTAKYLVVVTVTASGAGNDVVLSKDISYRRIVEEGTDDASRILVNGQSYFVTEAEGASFNNTTSTIEISGSKTWDDNNNQDGIRPSAVTVNLMANGNKIRSKTVTEEDHWSYRFTDLPKYENGVKIIYTVTEENVPGYTERIEGYNIINTHKPETVDVSGKKSWNDQDNRAGKRPESIVINLLADNKIIDSKTVTKDDHWSYRFTDLPKYNNGKKIVYSITENPVDDYSSYVSGYDVTNNYTDGKISVSGKKTWNDNNNQDGIRPTSIVINLLADGIKIDSRTVTADDKWGWSFSELDEYREGAVGEKIVYTIEEEPVYGYTTIVTGFNVVNTHQPEKVTVEGSKTWDDEDNKDGKRPSSIIVHLLADGEEISSKRVTQSDHWFWKFENLPKYQNGTEILYTIEEDAVENYTTTVDGYYVTNQYNPGKVNINGTKIWNDNNNQDGKRPKSITIRLFADGEEIESKTVTEDDNWSWNFENLDEYKSGAVGKKIVYTIAEDAVAGYTSQVKGYHVVNTHIPETVEVSGRKIWDDNDDQDGIRPTGIWIRLMNGTTEIAHRMVTEGDNWSWKFTDLPKYENGKEIHYTITESAVEGYTAKVTGYDVKNTHEPETVNVSGKKTWKDKDDQDGKRPQSITVRLLADGKETDNMEVTAKEHWSWNFENLPKYADGKEITYTVIEDQVENYSAVVSGYDITNSYTPGKVNVNGTKIWNDQDDQDGKRPESITIRLFADGEEIESKTVTEAENWSWNFEGLDEYKNGEIGKKIVYTIKEDAVDGYTSEVNGYNVINTHIPEKIDINGSKIWDDNDDQDGRRPDSIKIHLMNGNTEIAHLIVTEEDHWSWSFKDLPKYKDGKEILYTILEDAVDGYGTRVDGNNVINTHIPETVNVSGSKIWDDNNDKDGKRPKSITIRLLADGQEETSVEVTADDNWSWNFKNLPKYAGGKEIIYTIAEDPVENYSSVVIGYDVWNSYTPGRINISGMKIWDDYSDQDGKRPGSITVRLLADGEEVDSKIVSAADNWSWNFENMDQYKDGKKIQYTVTEDAVPDYTAQTVIGLIINTHIPETVEVKGSKTWEDHNNQDGKRPQSITVRLLADGKEMDSMEVTEEDHWSWSFKDLPKYASGKEIVYTITEDPVEDYSTVVSGYDITNSYTPGKVNVNGTKIWNDQDDQDGKRPESITIRLFADGEEIDCKSVTEADNWSWNFENLDAYKDGEKINYSISEDPVEGYETQINGYQVMNTYVPQKGKISVTKNVTFNGTAIKLDKTFYVALFRDSEGNDRFSEIKELEIKSDSADGTATVTFENLPYGTYYVMETEADGSPFLGTDMGVLILDTVTNGTVTLSTHQQEVSAAITNDYQDTPPGGFTYVEEPTTESEFESESEEESETETEKVKRTTGKVAKTGDTTNYVIYIILAVLALVVCGAVVYIRKRKRVD